ncbi:hypothetical protein, partial [Paenibacillus elgii]|uniref:hypothetical protein n=1 Tax=Paenibacillus elgii TaxID=189691 RepID=UPI00203C309D
SWLDQDGVIWQPRLPVAAAFGSHWVQASDFIWHLLAAAAATWKNAGTDSIWPVPACKAAPAPRRLPEMWEFLFSGKGHSAYEAGIFIRIERV